MEVIILIALMTMASAAIAMPLLIRQAPRLGLVDQPGGRKSHEAATPVVGGLALVVSLLPLAAWVWRGQLDILMFFPGAFLLLAISLADDLLDLDRRVRILTHAGIALIPVSQGLIIDSFGSIFGGEPVTLAWLAVPVTLFAVVSAINAMNMVDGVDGLLGMLSLIPLLFCAWLAVRGGLMPESALAISLSASLLVFLLFNFRFPWVARAHVFMGDQGSTVLGFALAWLLISLARAGAMPPVLALYLLAVPLMDMAGVILRRLLGGRSPYMPGRDHLHHILIEAGFSVRSTALLLSAGATLLASCGMLMWRLGVPDELAFLLFMVVLLSYLLVSRYPAALVRALSGWRIRAENLRP